MSYRIRGANATVTVGGDRFVDERDAADLEIDATVAMVLPGLVNAHDHLHRNHYPRLGAPPYADVYAWGRDLHARFGEEIARARALPVGDAFLWGALKNLLGAATTVVHHDAWPDAVIGALPVRAPRLRHLHSLGLEPEEAVRAAAAGAGPLLLHLAEGRPDAVAGEVARAAAAGLLDARLIAVHCVGVEGDDVTALGRAGAAIVWCPTSNAFLYGRGPSPALLRARMDLLLGTDALLTGDGTLLDELRAAARTRSVEPARLLDAVGRVAAGRLGLPPPSLDPGGHADFVVLRRPPLEAHAADLLLAVVAGLPRLGSEAFLPLFRHVGAAAQTLEVGGEQRWVQAPLGDVARSVASRFPEAARILRTPS